MGCDRRRRIGVLRLPGGRGDSGTDGADPADAQIPPLGHRPLTGDLLTSAYQVFFQLAF